MNTISIHGTVRPYLLEAISIDKIKLYVFSLPPHQAGVEMFINTPRCHTVNCGKSKNSALYVSVNDINHFLEISIRIMIIEKIGIDIRNYVQCEMYQESVHF